MSDDYDNKVMRHYDWRYYNDYIYQTDYYEGKWQRLTIGEYPAMFVELIKTDLKLRYENGLPKEEKGWGSRPLPHEQLFIIVVGETTEKYFWKLVDDEESGEDIIKCEMDYDDIYEILVDLTEERGIDRLTDILRLIFLQDVFMGTYAGKVCRSVKETYNRN